MKVLQKKEKELEEARVPVMVRLPEEVIKGKNRDQVEASGLDLRVAKCHYK
jgi:hypothetical protein